MTTTHFDQLQLAERWGLSHKTLERWRTNGTGPKYIRIRPANTPSWPRRQRRWCPPDLSGHHF